MGYVVKNASLKHLQTVSCISNSILAQFYEPVIFGASLYLPDS